jgi:hypothetical protein
MPGMLTAKQMDALRKAKDAEFDQLFLRGMIQHHDGALLMVKELFETAGAGQDAELFNFATDVDSGQRAEIKIMQTLLGKNRKREMMNRYIHYRYPFFNDFSCSGFMFCRRCAAQNLETAPPLPAGMRVRTLTIRVSSCRRDCTMRAKRQSA